MILLKSMNQEWFTKLLQQKRKRNQKKDKIKSEIIMTMKKMTKKNYND